MAVATKVVPAGEAMATTAAENALIDRNSLADAFGRYVRSGSDNLSGKLMARYLTLPCARNQAGAREHIVMADSSRNDANEHVARTWIRSFDRRDAKHLGTANVA
jgi:hypothetical protein